MIRVSMHFRKVLDLTNPRVVKYVEKLLKIPDGVKKILSSPSASAPLKEAQIINKWATSQNFEAIKVWSVKGTNEINYLIIKGVPMLEETSKIE
jgi:hypothetical protein